MMVFGPARRALHAARAWPVTSQQHACRNAMVAATIFVRQRREREDADAFVLRHHRRRWR